MYRVKASSQRAARYEPGDLTYIAGSSLKNGLQAERSCAAPHRRRCANPRGPESSQRTQKRRAAGAEQDALQLSRMCAIDAPRPCVVSAFAAFRDTRFIPIDRASRIGSSTGHGTTRRAWAGRRGVVGHALLSPLPFRPAVNGTRCRAHTLGYGLNQICKCRTRISLGRQD